MVQIPYLQPFDDVNKRVSRLARTSAHQEQPLALSVHRRARQIYTEAELGVYELTKIDLLKDILFGPTNVQPPARGRCQSLGEPDPFRLRYREQLREFIADLVRARCSEGRAKR